MVAIDVQQYGVDTTFDAAKQVEEFLGGLPSQQARQEWETTENGFKPPENLVLKEVEYIPGNARKGIKENLVVRPDIATRLESIDENGILSDFEAWEHFLAVTGPIIELKAKTFCRQYGIPFQVSDDITQEVLYKFVRVIRDPSRKIEWDNVINYLGKIIYTTSTDYGRRKRDDNFFDASQQDLDIVWGTLPSKTNSEPQNSVAEKLISHYLNLINSRHADILKLRMDENLTYKEIAEILGTSENTARSLARRGADKILGLCLADGIDAEKVRSILTTHSFDESLLPNHRETYSNEEMSILSLHQAEILSLAMQGLSYAQIEEITGRTHDSVSMHIFKARRKIKALRQNNLDSAN